jgi:CBS domain containing-hemolysin-like protein
VTEWLLLLLAFLLVLACGVFVAAEFSFVTVDRSAVARSAEQGERGAAGVQHALSTLSTQLSGRRSASR